MASKNQLNRIFESSLKIATVLLICPSLASAQGLGGIGGGGGGGELFPPLGDIQAQYNSYNLDILGDDLVGDHTDIDTGSLSLTQMDVSIPGNNDLPVAFGRSRSRDGFHSDVTWTGDWTPGIPYISKHYLPFFDNISPYFGSNNAARCTGTLFPPPYHVSNGNPSHDVMPESYFSGFQLNIPGRNPGAPAQMLNGGGSPEFAGTGARMVTKNNWIITCLPNAQTGGEGFIATAPNGDKYTFGYRKDYYDREFEVTTTRGYDVRHEVLYATRIEDVHGNWVDYEYSGGKPSRIIASDGREITFGYSGSKIVSITANGRTWTYQYSGNRLTGVILPDSRSWTIDVNSPAMHGALTGICALHNSTTIAPITITHPSGTTAKFDFTVIRNARTHMTIVQADPGTPDPGIDDCFVGQLGRTSATGFYSFAVTKKTLTVPGGGTYIWTRDYEQDWGTYTDASSHPADTKKRTITDPEGHETVFHVNRKFSRLEGSLMKTEIIPSGSSTPIRTIENSYLEGNYVGIELAGRHFGGVTNYSKTSRIYQTQTVTTQNGDIFTTENIYQTNPAHSDFAYGRPETVKVYSNRYGSTAPRETVTDYEHKTAKWVLGLPNQVTTNGRDMATITYNSYGQKTEEKRYGQTVATYGYHTASNYKGALYWMEDGLNRRWEALDWKRGTAQRIKRPDGNSLYNYVDNNGWLTSSKDARGNTTTYSQDSMGRLTLIDPPGSWTNTSISYNFGATPVQTITKGGRVETITYDGLHRPTLVNVNNQIYSKTIYNGLSQPTFKSFPSSSSNPVDGITMTYDALGRLESEATSAGTTTHEYLSHHRHRTTDPSGKLTDNYYYGYGGPDNQDYRAFYEYANGVTLRQTYLYKNIWGQLTRVKQWGDLHGSTVTENSYYYYDNQQRMCRYRTIEGGDTVYQYDAAGQLTDYQKGLANGTTCSTPTGTAKVSLTYDDLGRVTLTNYADSNTPDISKSYDLDSNLLTLNRGGVNWTYTYDTLSQIESEALSIDGRSYSLSYIYNNHSYLTQRTLVTPSTSPTGRQINYTYDALGRQSTVKDGTSNLATAVSYHPDGQTAGLTYGNGQVYTKTINNLMQPTRVWSQKGATKAFDRSYQYDSRGLVTNITDNVNGAYSQAFTYDGLKQLKTASGIWGSGSFVYDSLGNIRSKTLGSRSVVMSYASNNRLTSYTDSGAGPNKNLSYTDGRGNVTSLGPLNFVYDYADQPVSLSGSASGTYTYDGNFKRVKNTVGGTTVYTVYDASGSLVHIDDLGTGDDTDYVSGAGMGLARIENNAVTYLHKDHLGSASSGTDSSGSVSWTQHYTPFGEEWNAVSANDDQAGFTGHIKDKATGLNYMQARYYDPTIGRFLSKDPVTFTDTGNPAYFNRYTYSGNDPVNNVDPTGRFYGAVSKGLKLLKNGGDLAATFAGAVEDFKTMTDSDASVGERLVAVASLASEMVSPVSARDVKNGLDTAQSLRKTCCFVAGTLVDTELGLRPIEAIQVGDLVWARDVSTGKTELKTVTDLIRRHERAIWVVTLLGVDSETARFETTDDHPWWIAGQGWIETAALQPGMAVVTSDGRGMVVESVKANIRTDATYNLTVADFHTYFVGERRVLVHNCPTGSYKNTHESGKTYDGKGDEKRAAQSGRRIARDNDDPLVSTETRTASSDRESFKQESRSLDENGGPGSKQNYNQIESPGKKYREEDGEL